MEWEFQPLDVGFFSKVEPDPFNRLLAKILLSSLTAETTVLSGLGGGFSLESTY